MRKLKKEVLSTTNSVDTSKQTPIEIALRIDENGMTSLRNLYEFLELSPSQFTRWCKKNVLENPFATENVDYFTLRLDVDTPIKGQNKAEYLLTSDFAKQLSMTVKNERGKEARDYFLACEQGLKIATTKLQSNNNIAEITESLNAMTQAVTTLTNNMIAMQQDIVSLKEQTNKKKLPEKKYSRWKTNTFNKLNILNSYVNTHSDENLKLSEIIHLVIGETEDTYNIEINDYVDAYKSEFGLEANPYTLDVINRYKEVRDMFTLTLDSIMERLHIIEKPNKTRCTNIFDELAAQIE